MDKYRASVGTASVDSIRRRSFVEMLLTLLIISCIVPRLLAEVELYCSIQTKEMTCGSENRTSKNFDDVTSLIIYTDQPRNETCEFNFDLALNFPNIEQLYAGTNEIGAIKRDNFKGMDKLKELDLSCNNISVLPVDVFLDLESLQFLDISINPFKILPEDLLIGNKALETFYAESHQVEALLPNMFANNHKLKEVIMNVGPLKLIEVDFTKNERIELLDFFNNVCLDENFQAGTISIEDFQKKIEASCGGDQK